MPMKLGPGECGQFGESPECAGKSHIRDVLTFLVVLLNFSPTWASRDEDLPAKAKTTTPGGPLGDEIAK